MKPHTLIVPFLFATAALNALAGEAPLTSAYDGQVLLMRKKQIAAGDPALANDLKRLRTDADKATRAEIVTITQDKKHVAPGGDPHDYVSIGTYYWPNPDTPNGLPWINKDGVRNPLKEEYDEPRLGKMCSNVRTLALAAYLTGDDKYAARAVAQIRAWFFDPATRMNPNLEHAQMQPGKNEGSATGIIDSRGLTDVTDAATLLHGFPSWTKDDEAKLKKWFTDYYTWLTTSKNGKREGDTTNNHAIWYDVQAASIALYIGNEQAARQIAEAAKSRRIDKQIEPDGSMPREQARTLSVTYTIFNIEAFFKLARVAHNCGVDLWNYKSADGRSIRAPLDYVIPYATGQKEWTLKQIKSANYSGLVPLLREASRTWHAPNYEQAISQVKDAKANDRLDFLLPPEK